MSLEERFFLEYFFRSLIQEDAIGYVLLGGKPMAFFSYLKPKPIMHAYHLEPLKEFELFFLGFDDENALFNRGCEILKKYENLFCGKNIFFDALE